MCLVLISARTRNFTAIGAGSLVQAGESATVPDKLVQLRFHSKREAASALPSRHACWVISMR